MKLKKLSIAALAAFTLLSCTKEVEVIKEVPVEVKGTSRITLNLDPDALKSRAAVNEDNHYDESLTTDEGKIYNYSVFIFNQNGILEAALAATPYSPTNNTQEIDYTTPLSFKPGEVINPNNINSLYIENDGTITLSAGQKYIFTLINAPQTLLEKQENYLTTNTLTQETTKDEVLTMDDFALIVGSHKSEDGTYEFVNDITTTGNRGFMMTTQTQFQAEYLQPMDEGDAPKPITLTAGRAMAKVSVASVLVPGEQPNGDLEVMNYKVINNPKKMNVVPEISSNGVLTTPNYYDQTVQANDYFYSTSNYIKASEQGALTSTYCIENANRTPKQGNSTAVIIHGVYEPKVLWNETRTSNVSARTDKTFWRIQDKATKVYDTEYYGEAPDLEEIKNSPTAEDDYEVIEYTNGECYYLTYLKNERNEASEYTVKRNSYYRIDIVSVEAAGESDDDYDKLIPDPELPIEPQSFITVTISVSDWELVDQEGNL